MGQDVCPHLPDFHHVVYRYNGAWEIVFVGFLVHHLSVLVTVVGNFHAVGRCDSLVFSTEQLSAKKQGLYYDGV
jgi:hypothetical protein